MTASQLLKKLSEEGIRLWEEEGKLQFRAPKGAVNEEIKKEISSRKHEIISLLRHPDYNPVSSLLRAEPDLKNRNMPFPLSDVQSAYLIGRSDAFELGNTACHSYYELEQSGLDIDRLNLALNELIQKHETLRLVFTEDGTQKILENVPQYKVRISDFSDLNETDAKLQHDKIREELSHKIHDAGKWPLFEAGVIVFKDFVSLYFSLDLLTADFFSAFILFRDLVKFYDDPEIKFQTTEFSFRDYVLKEHELTGSKQFLKARNYWMDRINSFPFAPQLPFAKDPGSIKQPKFVRRESILDEKSWAELKQRAANYELTPSVVLMTAYSEILSRWSKNDHFAMNLTLFNRLPVHPDVMDIAGDFTCVNLLEVNTGIGNSFEEKAKVIQSRLWDDMDNRHFSGVKFIRELARINNAEGKALMPVVFSSTIGVENKNLTDFDVKRLGVLKYGITQTPQVFLDHQVIEHGGKLYYNWDAIEELFPEGLLDDMFEAYTDFIKLLSKDEKAWNGLIENLIPVKSPDTFSDEKKDDQIPQEMLHTLFDKQADIHPEKEAVVTSDKRLSYGELKTISDKIGGILRKEGALPGTLVGVVMEKGWEQVAGALGILKSGAAYLPIDPEVPFDRLEHLLSDGSVTIVLTQSEVLNAIRWPEHLKIHEIDKIDDYDFTTDFSNPVQTPDDLAYVIYTSGSTGVPKGVMIDHKSAVNTILDVNSRFFVTPEDKVFSLAAMNFDLSVYDIFGTLAAGATLVIPDHKSANDPAHWLDKINNEGITVWNSVPQLMQMLTEYLADRKDFLPDSLRLVMMSGDWIPLDLPQKIKTIFHDVEIYSLGGATEASIWSICYPVKEIEPGWKSIPYGRSMNNQKVYVLNKKFDFCPVWVTGDLYIGGAGLAKGYWNDKEKTDASFVTHPETKERLYKTGDLGRYLPDGNIEFGGREDFQVKISGYRIELGEIEAAINTHSGIKESVVSLTGEAAEEKRIAAYVVLSEDSDSSLLNEADPSIADFEDLLNFSGEKFVPDTLNDLSNNEYSLFYKYLEEISIEYICYAFNSVGIFTKPDEEVSFSEIMERGKIDKRFENLILQWLETLYDNELLIATDKPAYINTENFLKNNKAESLFLEIKKNPVLSGLVEDINAYLQRIREYFRDIIQGETEVLERFFDDDNLISPERLSRMMPGTDVIDKTVGENLKKLCDKGTYSRPLKILETGARTGEATAALIPYLPEDKVVYIASDASLFFTDKMENKFNKFSFISTVVFDVEKEPLSQGYQLNSFDVIITSNSLHRSADVRNTLKNIKNLLSPGGVLIVTESTINSSLQKISVGFIEEGFKGFADERAESGRPLLSSGKWMEILESEGFELSFSTFREMSGISGQDVIIAKVPSVQKYFSPEKINDFLKNKLPQYMIPSLYMQLPSIPLTSNGKVDRKALPVHYRENIISENEFKAPESEAEILLAKIWGGILKIDQISVNSNFFNIGGDSLVGTRIIAKVREESGIDISLRMLFEFPTIKELSEQIENLSKESAYSNKAPSGLPQIMPDRDNVNKSFPVTDVQHAYLIGRSGLYELGKVGAHCYFEFEGFSPDIEKLTRAINRLICHHDMMRSVFIHDDMQQIILKEVPEYKIETYDLNNMLSKEADTELLKIRGKMSHQIISTDKWPLFDIRASLHNSNCFRLHISFDNSVFDGWSMFHLISEMSRLYKNPEESLPKIDLSFRDYVVAMEKIKDSDLFIKDRDYWLGRLDELPPSPDLPMVKKPEAGVHYPFTRFEFKMEKNTWVKLKSKAKAIGITPSGLLLSAYAEILNSRSANNEFTINLTTFNRVPIHKQVNEIVGDFTSLTLLGVNNSNGLTFKERAKNLQRQLWQDMDHPYFSGVQVLRELAKLKGGAENARMPIVFTSALGLNSSEQKAVGDNSIGRLNYSISQTPQVLIDHQVYETSEELVLIWDTVKEFFPEGFIEDMFNVYSAFLVKLADDKGIWEENVFELISEKQVKQIEEVNNTFFEFSPRLLHTPFEEQALKHPESDALITSNIVMSYGELNKKSGEIANVLREEGVLPNTLVGVVMDKGWEQVAGVLGILMSGAAYLPITPDTPEDRLNYLLSECEVTQILTQSWLENEVNWPDDVKLVFVDQLDKIDSTENSSYQIQTPDDLAYVIYTSGSTGLPKGVMVNHKGPLNTIEDINNRFSVTSKDRVLSLAELNFDLSVFDIFGTLAAGGTIIIPDSEKRKDPAHWVELINDFGVTVWNSVPQLMQMFTDHFMVKKDNLSQSVRLVMMSGDWISTNLPPKIRSVFQNSEIISMGGATEASIWSILYKIEEIKPRWKSIPYGQPMANQRFYVLNEKMGNCPVWVTGNLYIGGNGLAKGYWKDIEKTEASFIYHPHTGEKLYSTGDLGCFLPDGNIEFMGRDDFQIKIRGYRIELGEIEATVKSFPDITECVVKPVIDDSGNKKLVGFVVHNKPIVNDEALSLQMTTEITAFLKKKLPEYMLPSVFLFLNDMPLNSNGKIDRKLLPDPANQILSKEKVYSEPVSYHEKEIAKIWKKALSIEKIDIFDSFFEIGGDSLIAVQLVNEFYAYFDVDISLPELFKSPTIVGMAEAVLNALENEHDNVKQREDNLPQIIPDDDKRYTPFPLTDVQHAYWIGRSNAFELGNVATHTYFEIENNNLNVEHLNLAWQKVVQRHEMLRAVVLPDGKQFIWESVLPYKFEIYDLRKENPENIQNQLELVRKEMEHQMLPVGEWPLFDIRVSVYNTDIVRIHLSFDALIVDGWSMGVIFQDWYRYYMDAGLSIDKPELSYRDYVLAERVFQDSDLYMRDKEYALERLSSLPLSPELPLCKNTENINKPEFKRLSYILEKRKWQNLKNRAKQNNLTPSGILIAAYAKTLGMWCKNSDFTINLTFFNRLPLHPEVNDIVGDFTSLTLLPVKNQGTRTFQIWAEEIQQQLWQELEHRYFSGVRKIRELAKLRGNIQAAIMPVIFTSFLGLELKDNEVSPFSRMGKLIYNVSQTPQVILDNQVSERDGELSVNWDVVDELFPDGLLNDMFGAYCNLLEILGDEDSSWDQLNKSLLPAAQQEKRKEFNLTDVNISSAMLHELFMAQVTKDKEKIAITTSYSSFSYGELSAFANHIGYQLQNEGIKPNNLVAIVMEKGWEQVAATLGILMSGGAYLPIAVDTPRERLKHLIRDGEVDIVLTQSWLEKDLEYLENVKFYSIDTIQPNFNRIKPLESLQNNDDLAYVIYTSGSTGVPKGVMIDHKGAVNTIIDINRRFGIGRQDRTLALSALNFDLSVFDIFGTLAAGGSIVIPDSKRIKDPGHWIDLIQQEKVTIWNSVPTLMRMLMEYISEEDKSTLESFRVALLSGDWIPIRLPEQIKKHVNNIQVVSLGGATEASIWSILYPIDSIDPDWKSIPYGKPMANQKIFVLNEKLEDCPEWVFGELYIGGIGLAKGYWHDEEKTDYSFIIHPETGERLYRTGDMGRYMPDGNIEFLGREDSQVKINGYRIELGELEAVAEKYLDVENVVVAALEGVNNEKFLSGYAVPGLNKNFSIEALQEFLQNNLNEYMLPAVWTVLDKLPLTSNGKIDRKSLPVPGKISLKVSADYVAPRNELEEKIASVIKDVVGIELPGIKEKFFNMGANSLDIVRIQNKLSNLLNRKISVLDLFEYSTIQALSQYLTEGNLAPSTSKKIDKRIENRRKATSKRKKRLLKNM